MKNSFPTERNGQQRYNARNCVRNRSCPKDIGDSAHRTETQHRRNQNDDLAKQGQNCGLDRLVDRLEKDACDRADAETENDK